MDRPGMQVSADPERIRPDAEPSGRALVPGVPSGPTPRVRGGRPLAEFLTQLIVEADPRLRPARSERTKAAAALYARAAAFERG